MDIALVTGGAGFIGSHIATALIERGVEVRVLDNLSTGHRHNLAHLGERVTFIEGDVRDADAVDAAVRGCRWVFHEAAVVSVVTSVEEPALTHEVNGTGTLLVLEAARRHDVERVLFAASAAAYGRDESLPKRETDAVDAVSPYAATKLLGEHYCSVYTATYGLPCFPLRYFNIFGPRQDPSGPYAGVISKFVDVMGAGNTPTVFGDGKQTRDFCHVADVVQANLAALDAPASEAGRPINIGTGRQTSLLDLIEALARIYDLDVTPTFREERPGDVRHSLADISRARSALGYEPSVGLDEGLADLVRSVREAKA